MKPFMGGASDNFGAMVRQVPVARIVRTKRKKKINEEQLYCSRVTTNEVVKDLRRWRREEQVGAQKRFRGVVGPGVEK